MTATFILFLFLIWPNGQTALSIQPFHYKAACEQAGTTAIGMTEIIGPGKAELPLPNGYYFCIEDSANPSVVSP